MADDRDQVLPVLDALIEVAEATTALLITRDGAVVAEAGDTSYMDTTAMAALVAGMFSATREVARMVGERQFSILLQQGENRHIHIGLISTSAMLVVVFEEYMRIGKVRLEARKSATALASILESSRDPALVRDEISMVDFKEVAFHRIDRIFRQE
jgi:predicted regulator of Ras-like GTPase activity (Roadblock/LC7/MglB family)